MVVNKARIESYMDETDGTRKTIAILGELKPNMNKILCPLSAENFFNLFKSAISNTNFKSVLCRACVRKSSINEVPLNCSECLANDHSDEKFENCPLDMDAIVIINDKKAKATTFVPKKEL